MSDEPALPARGNWRGRLEGYLSSPTAEWAITALILLNAFVIGLQTYKPLLDGWQARSGLPLERWLDVFDAFVIVIFTAELILRIVAQGNRFVRDGWNIFDAVVVGSALLAHDPAFSALRVLRILRAMRLLSRFRTLRIMSTLIVQSVAGCLSIAALMLITLFVFAILGHELFGATNPEMFGSLHSGMYTLFRVAALSTYDEVISRLVEAHPLVHFYLISYFMVMTFIVFNFFAAIILYHLNEFLINELAAKQEAKQEAKDAARRAESNSAGAARNATVKDFEALLSEIRGLRDEVARMKHPLG